MAPHKSTIQTITEDYLKTRIGHDNLKAAAKGTGFSNYADDEETVRFLTGVLIAMMEREQLSFKVQPDGEITLVPREEKAEH